MAIVEFHFKGALFTAEDHGKGPAILLLHGFLESRRMWKEIIPSLPAKFRKITLDLPGHGDSDNLAYVHTMEEMAAVVQSLVKHLGLRKFIVCGHSMGGYVALAFAERYPDSIRGLILMNSNSRADSAEKQANRERAIRLVKKNPKTFIRTSIPLLFRPKNRKTQGEIIKKVKEDALRTSAQGVVAALEGMKIRIDREAILGFAPYPILFVASQKDPVLDFKALKDQWQHPSVKPLILADGHMSHIENKLELVAGLKTFLNGL